MSNCGLMCVFLIWIIFLWPIIITSFYLIITKKIFFAKGKYFLLSTTGGYLLLIGFSFLISFLAKNYFEINTDIEMKILELTTYIILFASPVIFSHIAFRKFTSKTEDSKY